METFEFELIVENAGSSEFDNDELMDALIEAGCDDSTPYYRTGALRIAFDREGDSLEAAILSAIRDVEKTTFRIKQVEPSNIVNGSEIARRIGRSKQSINYYVSGERGSGTFPAPIAAIGNILLYNWVEVLRWLIEQELYHDDRALKDAEAIEVINRALIRRTEDNEKEVEAVINQLC